MALYYLIILLVVAAGYVLFRTKREQRFVRSICYGLLGLCLVFVLVNLVLLPVCSDPSAESGCFGLAVYGGPPVLAIGFVMGVLARRFIEK